MPVSSKKHYYIILDSEDNINEGRTECQVVTQSELDEMLSDQDFCNGDVVLKVEAVEKFIIADAKQMLEPSEL